MSSEPAPAVLIVEDDPILGGATAQRLKLEGFDVTWAKSSGEALGVLKKTRPDFVLSDIVLPDSSGEDFFRMAQRYLGKTPVLFVTAFGEIGQAVRLVKAGADDYLTKPYDMEDLIARIRSAIARDRERRNGDGVVAFGLSPATEIIAEQLDRVAETNLPVLITGETGTGKEVAARYLHSVSPRKKEPFVAVNCGAIAQELLESQFFGHVRGAFTGAIQDHIGFFEDAGEGTLFLDEIGDLDARLQTALLRVLQGGTFRPVGSREERRFQGRIVAATNVDLEEMRAQKRFRDDLYYRLSVVEIEVPPLRERPSEITALAAHFLERVAGHRQGKAWELSPEALDAMLHHPWPGNVRELRNRLERASVLARGELLQPDDIFPEDTLQEHTAGTLADARKQAEAEQIERALELSQGRVGEAAERLGISRTTLWKRRKSLAED